MPDGFTLKEVRQPASPSVSKKPVENPGKVTMAELQEEEGRMNVIALKNRKKQAHFGTSTRDGVTLERWDEDKGVRESHLPIGKYDGKVQVKYQGPPGPGTYGFKSDFEFRDPTNTDDKTGKAPKFHFGNKLPERRNHTDVPGVGSVEVDQAPQWCKNISHVFGTSFRPDLTNPDAHKQPGPGHYETIP